MSDVLLQAEIAHLRQAIKSAKAYLTALMYPDTDECIAQLRRGAQLSVEALESKLKAARYRLQHTTEVRQ